MRTIYFECEKTNKYKPKQNSDEPLNEPTATKNNK